MDDFDPEKRYGDELERDDVKRIRGSFSIKFLVSDNEAGNVIGRGGQKYHFNYYVF